jgi:magnesium-transporting ATPase (P-type)
LNILQLLCLNLLMTTLPALALALEPTEDYMPEREVMPDPLDRGQLAAIIFWGLLITAIGMISYLVPIINLKLSHAEAGTLAFCALGLAQTLNLFNIQAYRRNHDRETFWSDLLTTPVTWIVLIGAIVLELLAVYITPVSQLLGTASPDPLHLLIPAGAAIFLMGFAIRTSLSAR